MVFLPFQCQGYTVLKSEVSGTDYWIPPKTFIVYRKKDFPLKTK